MIGEHFDSGRQDPVQRPGSASSQRRYLGVHFACCRVYTRVYVNREETAYEGNCPRCGRPIRIRIGPGGTSQRFFTAS